jgi:hypothetical protein
VFRVLFLKVRSASTVGWFCLDELGLGFAAFLRIQVRRALVGDE